MSKSRGANMTPTEDEALCRAYFSVSVDSVTGANQTHDKMWETICVKYHQEPGIVNLRTAISLASRYHGISAAVQFFMGKLAHAINNQGSGTNEVDWVNEAREAYLIEKKKPFLFYKCYQILKDHPKFILNTTSSNSQRSRFRPQESGGSSVNLEDDSSPIDIEGPDSNRPIGRNAAKLQQKRKGRDKSISIQNAALASAEEFSQKYDKNQATNHENQQIMRGQMERLVQCREEERERNNREEARRIEHEQRAEESALMALDLSRMSAEQRELYTYRMNELLMRRRGNQQASQNFSNDRFF